MNCEIIYTFKFGDQIMSEQVGIDLTSKKTAVSNIRELLAKYEENRELVKASIAARLGDYPGFQPKDLPKWFMKCNGKLFF